MSNKPNSVSFQCQSCRNKASFRRLRETRGRCPDCKGALWTIDAVFQGKMERDPSPTTASDVALDLAVSFVLESHSMGRRGESRNEDLKISEEDVSSEDLEKLFRMDTPWKESIVAFLQGRIDSRAKQHRQDLLDKGAQNCSQCGTLFVPASHKPWRERGVCTKLCFTKTFPGEQVPSVDTVAKAKPKAAAEISVTCSNGHEFDVRKMYAGTRRPCPECGEKTTVP